ncbi:hypothetical protein E4U53_007177 [Claviceps sorghi]|nr:hypothetical protein E4U53_007177 [Claviceps sorghi]
MWWMTLVSLSKAGSHRKLAPRTDDIGGSPPRLAPKLPRTNQRTPPLGAFVSIPRGSHIEPHLPNDTQPSKPVRSLSLPKPDRQSADKTPRASQPDPSRQSRQTKPPPIPSNMAPRKSIRSRPTTPTPPIAAQESVPATSTPVKKAPSSYSSTKNTRAKWDQVLLNIIQHYKTETPQRTKLIDAFLFFLVVFVLTVSLRIQTTAANKGDFPAVSPERAFADFVVCSLILHFFCVNFIN